ncbi:hypothetical protein SAMN04489806_1086 [Paramicrobacterium humi]|uniref:YozE SAM-like fold n=1 Tax=Paramicrobacterium humi TaxID=640635 RepID=A0A1H4KBN5_9MICO|nr:hypothetical protein [Microbacterium humi]SEB55362.1 hypothetical protein SAMN04489806_1086 [Microbacterium humi]
MSTVHTTSTAEPAASFHTWVLRQASRDDPIGDLARDYKTGVGLRVHGQASSPDGLIKILRKQNAIQKAIDAADRLRAEWESRR